MEYIVIASGAYLVSFSFWLDCPNMRSNLLFKVIPGLIGAGNTIAGLNMAGIL